MSSEMKPNIAVGLKNGAFLFIYGFCVLMLSDLIRGCTKRSELPSETAWSVVTPLDADAQFTVYRNTFVGASEEPEAAIQPPKTRPAPDGVNTITENHDGTESMTLVHVRNSDETAMARVPHHVITQAEAEEVAIIVRDSINAHSFALNFYNTAVVAFKSPEDQEAILNNISRVGKSAGRLLEFDAKWRKRVEEGKP